MSTPQNKKAQLLSFLEESNGAYFSGQTIGDTLGISRAAVWKIIQGLREDGWQIESRTNAGYALAKENDRFTPALLQKQLLYAPDRTIELFDSISSTNTYLRSHADSYSDHALIVAREQTAGRGRYGKTFYAPQDSGLYMSFLLKPAEDTKITPANITMLTFLAGNSIVEAVQHLYSVQTSIKWVNDILYQNRKLCGILTEASLNAESGVVNHIVVGIGINVQKIAFPETIQNIAISLREIVPSDIVLKRTALVTEILNRFDKGYDKFSATGDNASILDAYRQYCNVIGKKVNVFQGTTQYQACVLDLLSDGSLLLEANGEKKVLNSGEISIRVAE